MAYKEQVSELDETHPDYKVLFSYLLPETTEIYYLNLCLNWIDLFEREVSHDDITYLKDWIGCMTRYLGTETPKLIQLLNRYPQIRE